MRARPPKSARTNPPCRPPAPALRPTPPVGGSAASAAHRLDRPARGARRHLRQRHRLFPGAALLLPSARRREAPPLPQALQGFHTGMKPYRAGEGPRQQAGRNLLGGRRPPPSEGGRKGGRPPSAGRGVPLWGQLEAGAPRGTVRRPRGTGAPPSSRFRPSPPPPRRSADAPAGSASPSARSGGSFGSSSSQCRRISAARGLPVSRACRSTSRLELRLPVPRRSTGTTITVSPFSRSVCSASGS